MTGELFGHYRLDDVIGAGAMGEVHRAFDTRKERSVAVKLLRPELAADAGYRARFRRESALAARITAPNVIPIHDYGEIDGRLFIEMQLVKGPDLATLLAAEGPLSPDRAVRILTHVAAALDAAHACGLVHRDVKPSNILLTGPALGYAYLVDFGLARSRTAETTESLTSGATVGTVAYLAPERFLDGSGDATADIYALACVLHEMLTGSTPFVADELPAMMYAHLTLTPPRASDLQPGVPAAFDAVIARGMAKTPADRYPSATALADAAGAAADRGAVAPAAPAPATPAATARPATTEPPEPGEPARRRGPRARRIAIALLGVVVAGAGAVALVEGGTDDVAPAPRVRAAVTALNVGSNPSLPEVSRDGKRVYVINDAGLAIVDTTTDAITQIPTAERAIAPGSGVLANSALSADGKRAYLTTSSPDRLSEVVAVIDTVSTATIAFLPIGPAGIMTTSLDISPDGRTLFATVHAGYADMPAGTTLKMIDTATGATTREVRLADGFATLVLIPPGARAYAALGPTRLAEVDLRTGAIGAAVPLDGEIEDFAVAPDGTAAYAATTTTTGIAVIDTATGTVRRTLPFTTAPARLTVGPDGQTLYVATKDGITLLDTVSGAVTGTVAHSFTDHPGPVAVTRDGRRAYVPDTAAAALLVVDLPPR